MTAFSPQLKFRTDVVQGSQESEDIESTCEREGGSDSGRNGHRHDGAIQSRVAATQGRRGAIAFRRQYFTKQSS